MRARPMVNGEMKQTSSLEKTRKQNATANKSVKMCMAADVVQT